MFYVFFYVMHIMLFSSFSCLMVFFSAVKRLMKEAAELKDPTDHYHAQPLEVSFFMCLQELVIRQFYSYILLIHTYLKCIYI